MRRAKGRWCAPRLESGCLASLLVLRSAWHRATRLKNKILRLSSGCCEHPRANSWSYLSRWMSRSGPMSSCGRLRDRNVVSIIEEHEAKHAEHWGLAPFDENKLEDKRQRVRDARAKALAAGVVGVGEKGPVLPNLAKQLLTIAERPRAGPQSPRR